MVRSTCSLWFGVSREGENTSFTTLKLGKVVSVKKIKVFVSVLDLGFQILFKCQNKKNSTKMKEKQDQKGEFCEN